MTRKEFITTLIEKKLKPLLFLIVLVYFVIYLFHEHNDDTNNNVVPFFNLVFSISILFLILGIIKYVIEIVNYNLPNSIKNSLAFLSKIINLIAYIGLFFMGYFSYIEEKFIHTILILLTIIYLTYSKIKTTK
ncbi:hypothetical protein [Flavobacterium cyclinae]|uniref:hypothetical protein n=1 Tax=Flavobacterium cyclinae TaxID=2895947 RepID=UPI001E58A574|nr:hypothetical protein [Flavobacterium cyclinae]UGS20185.1 hypothetical protein LOS86_09140 [Flavobacterium cyclinae]